MRKKFDTDLLPSLPNLSFEINLWEQGCKQVAGIDEAGRGAWAGPVFAAAVIFPWHTQIIEQLAGVNDSKKLSKSQRLACAIRVRNIALAWGIGSASASEIDTNGILPATRLAMQRAIADLQTQPQHLLIDYLAIPDNHLPQTPLVKGDARSLSIAAASILAKTARDSAMSALGKLYTGYGLEKHKGYGTSFHRRQLEILGPSPIHRITFKPLKSLFHKA